MNNNDNDKIIEELREKIRLIIYSQGHCNWRNEETKEKQNNKDYFEREVI